MEFPEFTFLERLLFLVIVLSGIAGLELLLRGRSATRWREYAFLLAVATAGALLGVLTDALTSSISPEYYTVGKGIPPGESFTLRALQTGAHAGFLAGAIVGAGFLMAGRPESQEGSASYRELSGRALGSAIAAVLGGLLALVVFLAGGASLLVERGWQFPEVKDSEAFLTVWATHAGVYAGGIVGAIRGGWRAWRGRSSAARGS